jgi:murein DD-endopeptidase MepM/ murein hydrolase activator NlpD
MAEDKQNGLSEVAGQGANAARALQGAVKTGKSVAAASKGAAAAGPYGAAAGALWAKRKHLGIIAAATIVLFILPVFYVAMLPAMVFSTVGGFFSGIFGGGPSGVPVNIMNDNAAIIENIETVGSALNTIMLESLDDLYTRIDHDFFGSGGDRKEVYNPYEGSNVIDANLIISQYCAANGKEVDKITLAELERTIRRNKSALFSFEKRVEIEISYGYDEEAGEETAYSETVVYYTVVYNGDTHFADAVFFLTPEQKALAADYSGNLHLFLNDSFLVTANTTHSLLAQLAQDNPYHGGDESFGSPIAADWQGKVTSEFGLRTDPITGKINSGHSGMDIGLPLGTEITAAMSGKVIYVRYPTTGYGYHLAIHHGNGLITLYAHCSRIFVSEGDVVSKGAVIAHVGSTGRSTGPHLHFEVIADGIPQNPRGYLPG